MPQSITYATHSVPEPAKISLKSVPAIRTWLFLLSSVLLAGNAMAQTPSWPIIAGHHLQPTQQQIDSRENNAARQRDRDAQLEIDRIFDELTGGSAPRKR
jgi:hypothetical protein